MDGRIFLLDENDRAVPLTEAKYESEDLFQRLIEQYPDILAGDQISSDRPRKWIFISREMGIPDHEGGSSQWFLDHLFIDQDSVPTFVEVKRSTDTRIRREVVAQMLDYAANATTYWDLEEIRSLYEERCEKEGQAPLEELDLSMEEKDNFWDRVESNLRMRKLRLLFVADEIPDSLRRIIEFLNEQMKDTEVLGVEIKQFLSGQSHRILVPKLLGQTTVAVQAKKQADFSWDEDSYLKRVDRIGGAKVADVCRRLLAEFTRMGCWIYWGTGQKEAGFVPIYQGKVKHQLAAVYSREKSTSVEIYFQHLKGPFQSEEKQKELIYRFNEIPGIKITEDRIFKRPSFPCEILENKTCFDQYIEIYRDVISQIQDYETSMN